MCGDWNGNGQQTPGIVRERDDGLFQWHLRNSLSGGPGEIVFTYGRILQGDRALVGGGVMTAGAGSSGMGGAGRPYHSAIPCSTTSSARITVLVTQGQSGQR